MSNLPDYSQTSRELISQFDDLNRSGMLTVGDRQVWNETIMRKATEEEQYGLIPDYNKKSHELIMEKNSLDQRGLLNQYNNDEWNKTILMAEANEENNPNPAPVYIPHLVTIIPPPVYGPPLVTINPNIIHHFTHQTPQVIPPPITYDFIDQTHKVIHPPPHIPRRRRLPPPIEETQSPLPTTIRQLPWEMSVPDSCDI